MRQGLDRKHRRKTLLSDLRRSLDAEALVRDVVGAQNVIVENQEVIHSCPLNFGLHSNGDQKPSASLNSELLTFNCYVCGGGDIFWYLQNVFDIQFEDAVEMLGSELRPRELSKEELISELEQLWTVEEQVSFSLPVYSEAVLASWKMYSSYLDKREVSREIQKQMRTGVDLKNKEKYQSDSTREEAWIEQPRVVIPHFTDGKLRGWLKRKIDDETQWGPKYRNSPGLPKNETLYNSDRVDKTFPVIVVESTLSVLKLLSDGHTNVVATFGAKMNLEQAKLLRGFDEVHLFMDDDKDGKKATESLIEELSRFIKVWVIPHSIEGADPADYTPEEVVRLQSEKVPGSVWVK